MNGNNKFNFITPVAARRGAKSDITVKICRFLQRMEVALMKIKTIADKATSNIRIRITNSVVAQHGCVPTVYPTLQVLHLQSEGSEARIIFEIPLLPRFLKGNAPNSLISVDIEEMYDAWLTSLARGSKKGSAADEAVESSDLPEGYDAPSYGCK